jgi:hypothetical protein
MEGKMPIGQTIGLLIISLLLGAVLFNGVVMLTSPAHWLRLPRCITFRGTLQERKYGATPFGRLQIRTLGLVLAILAGWMIAAFFGVTLPPGAKGAGAVGVPLDWWFGVATCLGVIGCGVVMLLKPKWWIAKYFRGVDHSGTQVALERAIRIVSLPCIAVGIYFLLQFITVR